MLTPTGVGTVPQGPGVPDPQVLSVGGAVVGMLLLFGKSKGGRLCVCGGGGYSLGHLHTLPPTALALLGVHVLKDHIIMFLVLLPMGSVQHQNQPPLSTLPGQSCGHVRRGVPWPHSWAWFPARCVMPGKPRNYKRGGVQDF